MTSRLSLVAAVEAARGSNRRHELVVVLGVAAGLASCASVRPSEPVRDSDPVTVKVCSLKSVFDTRQTLADAWARCWVKEPTALLPGTAARAPYFVTIDDQSETSSTIALVHNSALRGTGSVVMLADIRRTASCAAEVSVRTHAASWRSYAEHTKTWLDKPFDKGPGSGCS